VPDREMVRAAKPAESCPWVGVCVGSSHTTVRSLQPLQTDWRCQGVFSSSVRMPETRRAGHASGRRSAWPADRQDRAEEAVMASTSRCGVGPQERPFPEIPDEPFLRPFRTRKCTCSLPGQGDFPREPLRAKSPIAGGTKDARVPPCRQAECAARNGSPGVRRLAS